MQQKQKKKKKKIKKHTDGSIINLFDYWHHA